MARGVEAGGTGEIRIVGRKNEGEVGKVVYLFLFAYFDALEVWISCVSNSFRYCRPCNGDCDAQ